MTQFYQVSGSERLAVELAEELNKRGIHADILSLYTEDLPGVPEAKQELLDRGIPNVRFHGMKIHPLITSLVPAIFKLRKMIRAERYDIVETSMVSPTVLAAWATRGAEVRHVAGLHRVFRRDYENSIQHRFWRFSVRSNTQIRYYAISDYAKKCWIPYSKISPSHIRTIYNGIPDKCFDTIPDRAAVRKEIGIPSSARIAIYVGRLVPYKGIENILEALGPALRKNNLYLLYVGTPDRNVTGTGTVIQRMKHKIEQEKWKHLVHFLGYRNDVSRLLASSDVLVHPTQMEAFGLVLAESLAVGLPVVASGVQGIPEVLRGTDSIMLPPDNSEALREAVLKILNRTPDEVTRHVEMGRKRAEAFRMGIRTDSMSKLFEDVLEGRF